MTPHQRKSQDLVSKLLEWFPKNARDLPWRRTTDPYAVHVSEIMLQQTQVKTVIPYWERWMRELPTIESLARANADKIHKLWEGLGYYTRVRNLQKAAQIILEKYEGVFPPNHVARLALPGIGRYTAGAIGSIAFNQPVPILDGNVIRVLTRVFGLAGNPKEKKTNEQLWQLAADLVACAQKYPANACSHCNQALMELGALVCTPREPRCPSCPIRTLCTAFRDNRTTELPRLSKQKPARHRHFLAFIVRRENRFLVQQRPAGVVNAHLWEFPNVEIPPGSPNLADWAKPFLLPKNVKPTCRIKHAITRYRITLEAFASDLPAEFSPENPLGIWQTTAELQALAFTSAHRKILTRLLEEKDADRISP